MYAPGKINLSGFVVMRATNPRNFPIHVKSYEKLKLFQYMKNAENVCTAFKDMKSKLEYSNAKHMAIDK